MLRHLILIFVMVIVAVRCCEVLTEAHHGCKIENSQCVCSFGCKSEFRYTERKFCIDALKGRANDICSRAPCLNGGTCIQISLSPGFKCQCQGTKFFGNRCQRPCPKEGQQYGAGGIYPHECIEI